MSGLIIKFGSGLTIRVPKEEYVSRANALINTLARLRRRELVDQAIAQEEARDAHRGLPFEPEAPAPTSGAEAASEEARSWRRTQASGGGPKSPTAF